MGGGAIGGDNSFEFSRTEESHKSLGLKAQKLQAILIKRHLHKYVIEKL